MKLETKKDFDEFLVEASKLVDTGETINTEVNPEDLQDALNFRFTI